MRRVRETNTKIARDLDVCVDTVRRGRASSIGEGMPGLFDRPRSGRPPVYGIEEQLLIVATVTGQTPDTAVPRRSRPVIPGSG